MTRRRLPNITSLVITRFHHHGQLDNFFLFSPRARVLERIEDDRVGTLVQHIASLGTLQCLTLDHIQYLPNTFRHLSQLYLSLVDLTITKCRFLLFLVFWLLC